MTKERCKRFWRLYAWFGVILDINQLDYIAKQCREQKKKD